MAKRGDKKRARQGDKITSQKVALVRLNEGQVAKIEQLYFDGWTQDRIAAAVGLSRSAV